MVELKRPERVRQHSIPGLPSNQGLVDWRAALQSTERWLPVVGYEGYYEVSDRGRVRSLDRIDGQGRNWPGAMRKISDNGAYLSTSLWKNGRAITRRVHLLVLDAFVGPAPEGMEACHNDGNGKNNHLENLRWDTHSSNLHDVVRHGRHHMASRTACARGHLLVPENLDQHRLTKLGSRRCLACERGRGDARRAGDASLAKERADAHYAKIMAARARMV